MAYSWPTREEACNKLDEMDVPAGTNVKRDHNDGSWYFADVEGNALVDPADVADEEKIEPMREAQDGDVILQIGGPGLPSFVMLEAIAALKKLGIHHVVIRDAMNPSEVIKTLTKDDVKGMKGAKAHRVSSPTDTQQIVIDLCTRPQGATGKELEEAGAGGKSKKGAISWSQLVPACERYGYSYDVSGRTAINNKGNKVLVTVYHLRPIGDASDERMAAD